VATKCHCDPCRKANREYAAARNRKAVEAAAAVAFTSTQAPQVWTAPDGTKQVRLYKRACPGPDGKGCPHKSHLRKDSKGGVCGECRKKLVWNGLVPAEKAREHLLSLSAKNVGRRAVRAACDVADSVLEDIRAGRKTQIRADTERRILSVDEKAISDHALVPAAETWRLINLLRKRHSFTKIEIAQALGHKVPSLQIKKNFVLASTAKKVERLYRQTVEKETEYDRGMCPVCRMNHAFQEVIQLTKVTPEQRQEAVLALLPDTGPNIRRRLPCLYGEDDPSKRKLYRDLRELGASIKESNDAQDPIWSVSCHQAGHGTREPPRMAGQSGHDGVLA